MFCCEQDCDIAMQCCNTDVQVARTKLQSRVLTSCRSTVTTVFNVYCKMKDKFKHFKLILNVFSPIRQVERDILLLEPGFKLGLELGLEPGFEPRIRAKDSEIKNYNEVANMTENITTKFVILLFIYHRSG